MTTTIRESSANGVTADIVLFQTGGRVATAIIMRGDTLEMTVAKIVNALAALNG